MDNNLATPDRIIRDLFADSENSANFFRHALPEPLVRILELSRIETLSGTFIDEKMREYRSDLLYRIPTTGGSFTEIYLLFEHKSSPSPQIFIQLLGYLSRIYESQEKAIPVIPFVFHHGETGWNRSRSFVEEFELEGKERELIEKYIPDFSIEVFDLTERDISQLRTSLLLYAFLSTIHHLDEGDLEYYWDEIAGLTGTIFLEEKGIAWFQKLKKGDMAPERIRKPIASLSSGLESIIMTTAERLIKQGIEQGIDKGKLEGKLEDAKRFLELGVALKTVLEATGLSKEDLIKAGILK